MVNKFFIFLSLVFILSFQMGYSQIQETQLVKDTVQIEQSDIENSDNQENDATLEQVITQGLNSKSSNFSNVISKYIPGIGTSFYTPKDVNLGSYQGISINLIEYSMVGLNEKEAPSYGQTYYNLELFLPFKENSPQMIFFSWGARVSFESKVKRNYLIPYYEFCFKWGYNSEKGDIGGVNPAVGIWLINKLNFNINLFYSYFLPIKMTEKYAGQNIGLQLNYLFW